jgi:branched-chain amino acid transport system permease protein
MWELMDLFIQRCFDGVFNGAIYASLAVAIVMIHRSTGIVNFAQGEMALMSGYVALVLLTPPGPIGIGFSVAGTQLASRFIPWHPWPPAVAIIGAIVFGALCGLLIERLVMRRLDGHSNLAQINATIGLLILLNGLTFEVWGSAARKFPSPFPNEPDDFFLVAGARLRYTTIGVCVTLTALLAVLWLVARRTKIGLAFRAVTSNRESAALSGIPITRTLMTGWATAAGIGALAAALVGGVLILQPVTMLNMLIYAFAAMTIGGMDSPGGAVIGGLTVGITQALAPGYLGVPSELTLVPPLVVMLIVLTIRPQGLFGTSKVQRV